MTRYRPQFSLRTLAIIVTMACAYLPLWDLTKRHGVPEKWKWSYEQAVPFGPQSMPFEAGSPMPFVVVTKENVSQSWVIVRKQRLYFWFFGYKLRLWERTWTQGKLKLKPGFQKNYRSG